MYIPRYWQRATVKGPNREGKIFETSAWGWSDASNEEALAKANERANAALLRMPVPEVRGSHYYGERPFREPILEDVTRGGVKAIITRNSLGCDVLNVDRVGFGDIDYQRPQVSLFKRLFGGAKQELAEHRAAWERDTLDTLRAWQKTNADWGFRVYRTAGGIRVLITSRLLEPAAEAQDWLAEIGSDPLYRTLCANQKSFRARLTPKPWRCNVMKFNFNFPCANAKEEQRQANWLQMYREKCRGFAVCELIETVGPARIDDNVRPVLDLHDARTAVGSGMPLG